MSTKPNAWGVHNRTQRHLRAFLPGFEPVKATRSVRRAGTLVTLVTTILFAEGVVAQSGHLWVDPFWLREPPPPDSSSPTPTGRSEPPPEEPRPIQIAPVPQTRAPAELESEAATVRSALEQSGGLKRGAIYSPKADSSEVGWGSPPEGLGRQASQEAGAPEEQHPHTSDRAGAAQNLATTYLSYWSAPNALALDTTPDFYGPEVLFHGRQMSARALFEEKRRFVRRWPVRQYWPRRETMQTNCDPTLPICTVRTAFDFIASNPQTGKRSQGTALLELGVSFADDEPMIVVENSQVISRGSTGRGEAFEFDEDDGN